MSIFGRIVTRTELENAAKVTVQTWISTYLAEVERQHGIVAGRYERPRGYSTTNDFDRWEEDQLPCIIIVSPGMSSTPVKRGDGNYNTWWALGVGVVCSGDTEHDTRAMVDIYTAAIRALLIQRPSLNQFAQGLNYEDERYDEAATENRRSLQAGYVVCTVEVDNVVMSNAGPMTPSDPPSPDPTVPIPDWPVATGGKVGVQIVKELP